MQGRERGARSVDGRRGCDGGGHGTEERVLTAARIGGALGRGHGVQRGENLVVLDAAGTGVLAARHAAHLCARGRRVLAVAALAPQRLIGGCGRGAAAAVRVVDVILHVLVQLLEEEGALQPHLLYGAVQTIDAQARAVVVLLNVVYAAPQLDAFAVVCRLDRRGEVF